MTSRVAADIYQRVSASMCTCNDRVCSVEALTFFVLVSLLECDDVMSGCFAGACATSVRDASSDAHENN